MWPASDWHSIDWSIAKNNIPIGRNTGMRPASMIYRNLAGFPHHFQCSCIKKWCEIQQQSLTAQKKGHFLASD
jgi:hypothetical protein